MPYKERSRQFLLSVTGGRCIYEPYTEKHGFRDCGAKATDVHHIYGEGDQLAQGEDPEHSMGIPLCQEHHTRNTGEVFGEPDASFHPRFGEAYKHYKEWKQNQLHMNSITGKRTIDYSTSPFADAARQNKEDVKNGERYINGDERTDEYYEQKMRCLIIKYLAEHPEEKVPNTKPHPLYDPSKRKRWYNYE